MQGRASLFTLLRVVGEDIISIITADDILQDNLPIIYRIKNVTMTSPKFIFTPYRKAALIVDTCNTVIQRQFCAHQEQNVF